MKLFTRTNFVATAAAILSLATVTTNTMACNLNDGYTNCGPQNPPSTPTPVSSPPAAAQNAASAAVNNTTQNTATNTSNASGTVASSTQQSGPTNSFTATINASGSLTNAKLELTVTNTSSKSEDLFVCAIVPNGGTFILNKEGKWVAYTGAATAPSFGTATPGQSMTVSVFANVDTSSLVGAQIYVGAGTTSSVSGNAWNSMINNGTYNLAYTVK